MKIIIKITNIDTDEFYFAERREDCKSRTDKSGFDEAHRAKEVVSMGHTIFEPFHAPDLIALCNCVACLHDTLKDIMPQAGNIAFNDYDKLNRGLMLAEKLLIPVVKPCDNFHASLSDGLRAETD